MQAINVEILLKEKSYRNFANKGTTISSPIFEYTTDFCDMGEIPMAQTTVSAVWT